MHKHHRQKQTDGDTERHNDSGAEVPQEQHEDNDGQQRAEQQIFQHRADDQIDVLALIAEGGEVQTIVFFLQLGHGGIEIIAGTGGGSDGGLLYREQHTVIAVYFGVQLLGVIRQADSGDIGQANLPHIADIVLEEHPVLQLLQAGKFIADLEGILPLGALDIAGGHREVLRHEQLRNGGLGENAVQPGGLVGGIPLLTELLLGFIESLFGLL